MKLFGSFFLVFLLVFIFANDETKSRANALAFPSRKQGKGKKITWMVFKSLLSESLFDFSVCRCFLHPKLLVKVLARPGAKDEKAKYQGQDRRKRKLHFRLLG